LVAAVQGKTFEGRSIAHQDNPNTSDLKKLRPTRGSSHRKEELSVCNKYNIYE